MTAGRITGPRIAIGAVLTALTTVIVWSCAGELDDVERYRLGASTLRSCFGDDEPPRFLTSSRCKQCHLSKDNGIGAALDLSSGNIGGRFSQLIGACPEELLVDPANPEASTLYRYLNDEIDGCTYHKMPPTGAGLSSADKRCLLTWIDGLDDVDDLQLDDGAPVDDGEGAGGDGDGGDTMPGDGDGDMMPGDMDMDPPAPTLTEIREQIFDVHCAGCHDTGSPSAGLELGPDVPIADLYDNLVNVPVITNPTTLDYVEPNNIGASFLVRKLRGTMDTAPGCDVLAAGSCGLRMPRNLPALSDPLIEMVEDWINAGALEN